MSQPKATFWRGATVGTAYYRCQVPAKHLPGSVNKLTLADLAYDENGEIVMPFQRGSTAIWQFAGNATSGALMAFQQEQGTRVLMEVDDNYLTLAPYMSSWQVDFARGGEDEDGDKNSLAANRRISEWVDGVICSTERLCEHYAKVNSNVYHCPNSIDPDDWEEPKPKDGPLKIVWAASDSHIVDAPLVRRALEWAVKQPNVEVYLIGFQPFWRGKFHRIEWVDSMEEHRKRLISINPDVGICALNPSAWADCKSDVKALEYGVAGAISVCSDVEPYRPLKGTPAIFAKSGKDFERVIQWAVRHPDEAREMGQRARNYVLTERTIQTSIHRWREAVA